MLVLLLELLPFSSLSCLQLKRERKWTIIHVWEMCGMHNWGYGNHAVGVKVLSARQWTYKWGTIEDKTQCPTMPIFNVYFLQPWVTVYVYMSHKIHWEKYISASSRATTHIYIHVYTCMVYRPYLLCYSQTTFNHQYIKQYASLWYFIRGSIVFSRKYVITL